VREAGVPRRNRTPRFFNPAMAVSRAREACTRGKGPHLYAVHRSGDGTGPNSDADFGDTNHTVQESCCRDDAPQRGTTLATEFFRMRPETLAIVDEIKQSLSLLRRYL
jgi:hypothetical protein